MRTIFVLLGCLSVSLSHAGEKVWTIMAVGDSITEGGDTFSNYREPLAKRLKAAGYSVKFVGSRVRPSPLGALAHEGYGGKNSAFLAKTVPQNYQKYRADIVLLHACHNQFADQGPVPGLVRDHQAMIDAFRRSNPYVIVLVAGPIPSAKLPKYSYLPAAGKALEQMVKNYQKSQANVRFVDQSVGFDAKKDTIADMVHPNAKGAEKMAERWFAAISSIIDRPQ